jgi:hypothetical protein
MPMPALSRIREYPLLDKKPFSRYALFQLVIYTPFVFDWYQGTLAPRVLNTAILPKVQEFDRLVLNYVYNFHLISEIMGLV